MIQYSLNQQEKTSHEFKNKTRLVVAAQSQLIDIFATIIIALFSIIIALSLPSWRLFSAVIALSTMMAEKNAMTKVRYG